MSNENLKLAQEKFLKGDKKNAKNICLNLIYQKLDTNVFNFLGVIELSENNYQESLKHFHKSLDLNPNNVKALERMSDTFKKNEMYEEQINILNLWLSIDKGNKKAIAEKFADAFEDTNPLFKRDLFIKATKAKVEKE